MHDYRAMMETLDEKVCFGQQGSYCPWAMKGDPKHRRGFIDPFGVIHWDYRRWTRRGSRNLLLLIARSRRERDPEFLNDADLRWYHIYWDHREMDRMAAQCGFRIPARLSLAERTSVFRLAALDGQHLARDYPTVYRWALGAWDIK